jgi:hypothetical protein
MPDSSTHMVSHEACGAIRMRSPPGSDEGADRRIKPNLAPVPSERDGIIDRTAVGIQHDGRAAKVSAAGEFIEIFQGFAGDDSYRADPAPAIRFACNPSEVHRQFSIFEHGNGVSGSTNRGHHAWQRHAEGNCTKQRRPARSKTELAEAAIQCLVALFASGPNSASLVQTFAIRRNCDRRTGLTLLFANCVKSDARRRHSKSCFREYSESGIVPPRTSNRIIARRRLACRWSTPRTKQIKSVGNESSASWCASARL